MKPFSEQYRLIAEDWVDKDAAARLYEETKSAELERRKMELIKSSGEMADNRAERLVKASDEWMDYVMEVVRARTIANKAKVALKVIEMRYYEEQAANATARAEMRLT
jgi:NurA-like 5'-3' nuclease